MRITDKTIKQNYIKTFNKAKANYSETNQKIASGNKFIELSEDVSAGTRMLNLRVELFKSEKQLLNVQAINSEFKAVEDSMMSMNDVLNEIIGTKLVKATSETTGEAGRVTIASEIKSMKEELIQFANMKFATKYPFGGSTAKVAPFSLSDDEKLLYNGVDVDSVLERTDGSRYYMDANGVEQDIAMDNPLYLDIGLGVRVDGDSFNSVSGFEASFSGVQVLGFGTTEDGMSNNIINILTEIEDKMINYDLDKLSKLQNQLVNRVDIFRTNVTDIGAKTNFLDTMETRLTNQVNNYKFRIDELIGVNDAEEATNQSMNDYILKTVIQMGSKMLPVSLFDFLK
jgi:flagellin-like hook-associated protein FlgL